MLCFMLVAAFCGETKPVKTKRETSVPKKNENEKKLEASVKITFFMPNFRIYIEHFMSCDFWHASKSWPEGC